MVLTASSTANFVGSVAGNHVMISETLPPDLSAPTTVRFLKEPVTGSVTLVQNGRRTVAELRSVELVQGLSTAMDNVARSGGGYLTLMHADTTLSQQKIPSASKPSTGTSPCLLWVGGLVVVLILIWLAWKETAR